MVIAHLPAISDDACYRAMDWLLEVKDDLEKEVFSQVANLLNLEAGLLFSDTTSTHFKTDREDALRRPSTRRPLARIMAPNEKDEKNGRSGVA